MVADRMVQPKELRISNFINLVILGNRTIVLFKTINLESVQFRSHGFIFLIYFWGSVYTGRGINDLF